MKKLIIADKEFDSRLFLGTGKFNSNEIMEQAILASGTEMVTVAMKITSFIRISNSCPTLRVYARQKKPFSPLKWLVRHSVPTG